MIGSKALKCLSDGEWNGTEPECVPVISQAHKYCKFYPIYIGNLPWATKQHSHWTFCVAWLDGSCLWRKCECCMQPAEPTSSSKFLDRLQAVSEIIGRASLSLNIKSSYPNIYSTNLRSQNFQNLQVHLRPENRRHSILAVGSWSWLSVGGLRTIAATRRLLLRGWRGRRDKSGQHLRVPLSTALRTGWEVDLRRSDGSLWKRRNLGMNY